MARRLYVDTSAYLCVLLGERGHQELQKEFRDAELLTSSLLVLETNRNLVRLSREGCLSTGDLSICLKRAEQDLEAFIVRDLTVDLCTGTSMPLVSTPRSLDLGHLRTALWFHGIEPLSRFVTLDGPQESAAMELGLPV